MFLIKPFKIMGIVLLLLVIVVFVAIEWWLPNNFVKEARAWYSKQGDNYYLDISEIDIRPLSNAIQLSGLKLKQNDKEHLLLSAYIEVRLTSLIQKHFVIEKLTLSGLTTHIEQQQNSVKIAGVTIGSSSTVNNDNQAKISKSEVDSGWLVSVLDLDFKDINIDYRNENRQLALKLNKIKVKGELGEQDLAITLDATVQKLIDYDQGLYLKEPFYLDIEGRAFDVFDNPYWKGLGGISNIHLETNGLEDISLKNIEFDGVELKKNEVTIKSIYLDNFKINDKLLGLKAYKIENILYQDGLLMIAEQEIVGWNSIIDINKNNTFIDINKSKKIKEGTQLVKKENKKDNQEFDYNFSKIKVFGENKWVLKDQYTTPKVNIEFLLNVLEIQNISSDNQKGGLKLEGKFDEYSELETDVQFNIKSNEYLINLSLEQFNLTTLNGYIERSLGYHIERGLLDLKLKAELKNSDINGNAEILIRKIALVPTDELAIERLSRQISMPVDTAISLLTDSNQNLKLQIPISGNINDPNFGKKDLVNIIAEKALKIAIKHYLTQTLLPYGLLVNAVEYVGSEIFSIKLESMKIEDGKLTEQQKNNLTQVAKVMRDKNELQLYICPVYDKENIVDNWQEISINKANIIKRTLVEFDQDLSKRVVLCEPKLSDDTEVRLGF